MADGPTISGRTPRPTAQAPASTPSSSGTRRDWPPGT